MLDFKTAATIATSIVQAKLDYCNSLFLNIDITQINRLQAIQNVLARAVTKPPNTTTSLLSSKSLHWLKIPERIEYKFISLTYNTLRPSQSSYLRQLFTVQPLRSTRSSSTLTHTAPPSRHLITLICKSLHSHSCTAPSEQTPAFATTNIRSIPRTHQNLTSCYLSTGLPLKTENTAFSQILSRLPSPTSPFQL